MSATFAKTYQNYSPDWWTPDNWIEWVNATFKRSFFDPCGRDWKKGDPSGLDIAWLRNAPYYVNHPGSRGSVVKWWPKFLHELKEGIGVGIWCAFSVEQIRHMRPSPFELDGWLVLPRERVPFIWGGPDKQVGTHKKTGEPIIRKYGEPATSPGNWTVFWSTENPATPPVESEIVKTGKNNAVHA